MCGHLTATLIGFVQLLDWLILLDLEKGQGFVRK
jgi:hypothetical protein